MDSANCTYSGSGETRQKDVKVYSSVRKIMCMKLKRKVIKIVTGKMRTVVEKKLIDDV